MSRDALVVGINKYPFLKDLTGSYKHLKTPASDAEAIAQRLEEYGDFRVRRLPETIQGEQRRVTPDGLVKSDTLENAIIRLFNPVGENIPETALLYFIGHGLRKNRGGVTEGFLAASDVDPQKNQWGISLRWLRELLQKSPVKQQIVWLDCCYSGELFNFVEADLGTSLQEQTRFLIAASREFEPAEEDIQGKHGVFSKALLQGLDPRQQSDGLVNNDKLIEYIAQNLKDVPQQPIWYNPNREIVLTGERKDVPIHIPEGVCPYKGLRFFDVEDATYFYGREVLTQKLIQHVQVNKGNFLAVLGVSGSGKSSLLRAGLIYQLQQQRRLPETEQWKIRIFSPGERPLVSLATAFLDESATDIQRAEQLKVADEAIAQGETGLARLIRASRSPRTLLIVDQFEEIFTVCQSHSDRQQFISSLLGALKQTGDKLCIIFAMRDDFLGKCAAYHELTDLIQTNLVMVTPMSLEELQQAIREPAAKLGRKVEENLINAILKDLGVEIGQPTQEPEPGTLPLLSYTLEQLWQRQKLNWLKLDSYHQLGGVRKTLENLAEKTYKELSTEEQRVTDLIFINLTQLGEGTPDTRKQVPQRDLVSLAKSAQLVEQVIQKLAQAKLIVTSEQRRGEEKVAVVDVSHEALIRHWSRLRELLDNNREAIRNKNKLEAAAKEWDDNKKSGDYLLRGLQLAEAEKFLQDEANVVLLKSLAQEFIKKSISIRNLRRVTLGSVTCLISISLLGLTSWALLERTEANKQNFNAEIRVGITSSKALLASDQQLESLLEAIKAGRELKQLQQSGMAMAETQIQAVNSLREVVYGIQEHNRLEGHNEAVMDVSFSPDGQLIATVGKDKTIKLWRRDGHLLQTLNGHTKEVTSVSFSPDGQILASVSNDGTVKLWQIDGRLRKSIPGREISEYTGIFSKVDLDGQTRFYGTNNRSIKWVTSLGFSPNSQTIALASDNNTVKLWHINGHLIKTFNGHKDEVTSVSFSPDGQILASASRDGMIKLWRLDGVLFKTLQTDSSAVNHLSFSPDGQILATASDNGKIHLWDKNGTLLNSVNGHSGAVLRVSFSPDGKTLASASDDNTVKLWSREGILLKTLNLRVPIMSVKFSPDGHILASAGWDKVVKLWQRDEQLPTILKGHKNTVSSVRFSPDRKMVASASWDKTVKLWQPDGRLLKTILIGYTNEVFAISFSPDGQLIASARDDGIIQIWHRNGTLLSTITAHKYDVNSVIFSPDGQMFASGSKDKTVKLWNHNGHLIRTFKGHTDTVSSVSFSPDSQLIASASLDKTVKIWHLNGHLIHTFKGHDNAVSSVSFSPDGQLIASASWDKTVKIWHRNTHSLLYTLKGHNTSVLGVSFSPDSQFLASSGDDGTVKLWSRNGTLLSTLNGHKSAVLDVSFSSDGKTLASASYDKTVILWNLDLDNLIVRGCNWLHDYLENNPNGTKYKYFCDNVRA